jgi:hypothetical protein
MRRDGGLAGASQSLEHETLAPLDRVFDGGCGRALLFGETGEPARNLSAKAPSS